MTYWRIAHIACMSGLIALLTGCASSPGVRIRQTDPGYAKSPQSVVVLKRAEQADDAAMYAFSLLDKAYKFGGNHPDSGLDCSGLISWVYAQTSDLKLPHNAAQIANMTRLVEIDALQPGDLVFYNTMGRPNSHVGLYIGEGKFIHAPSEKGKVVRVERMDNPWFAARYDGGRTLRPTDTNSGGSRMSSPLSPLTTN